MAQHQLFSLIQQTDLNRWHAFSESNSQQGDEVAGYKLTDQNLRHQMKRGSF
jgi:hypothetical protein